jgi:lysophospholipase L1-like esterase
MQTVKRFFTLLACLVVAFQLQAQDGLAGEIKAFKKKDSVQAPPKNPILFVGSSSFRLWPNVQADFPGYTILNRGFGGSTLPDVTKYAEDIIFPYNPKQIVIYCGENDIASDVTTAQVVFERFEELFTLIRKKMPKVPVAFVAMKPSPSREKFREKLIQANQLIKDYLAKQSKAEYIDIYPLMMQNGISDESLYGNDRLHMNAKGYAIWQKAIQPYLKK